MQTAVQPIEQVVGHPWRAVWPAVVVTLWLAAAVGGMWMLWNYSNREGEAAVTADRWPGNGQVELNSTCDTLVMFIHPHCPCTRASIAELQRIVAKNAKPVAVWIVAYRPTDVDRGWEQTDLLNSAREIPGAHVVIDADGQEARRFGAATSGQVLLYAADGKLLFRGGITASRGHEGDNIGKDAVLNLLNDSDSQCHASAVFGCSIVPASSDQK